MKNIKIIITKIFNKRYKIDETINSHFTYACEGRIIRSFGDQIPKKKYCAAYVLDGLKK